MLAKIQAGFNPLICMSYESCLYQTAMTSQWHHNDITLQCALPVLALTPLVWRRFWRLQSQWQLEERGQSNEWRRGADAGDERPARTKVRVRQQGFFTHFLSFTKHAQKERLYSCKPTNTVLLNPDSWLRQLAKESWLEHLGEHLLIFTV